MQMYRLKFARKINDHAVDIGDVIVCASSQETALVAAAQLLALPVSDTQFEVTRIKPSFFQVSRRTVDHRIPTFDADTVDEKAACRATFLGVTETMKEKDWYSLSASADIRAESEDDAVLMLSRALTREISGEPQKPSLRNFDVTCDRASLHPRTAAVEENALFTVHRIFQGGDTRT